nr:aminoglycoside phosphotransferase family protein [Actinoplanes ianthinogenes]
MPERQERCGGPLVSQALRYAVELPGRGEQVLVHADLHYGNILAGRRRPWLAIDPRPVRGAPEHAVPELMWSRADDLSSGAEIRRLLSTMVDAGGLDGSLARAWVITRCVDYWLWGVERGLTVDPVRCSRVLAALLPDRSSPVS